MPGIRLSGFDERDVETGPAELLTFCESASQLPVFHLPGRQGVLFIRFNERF